MPCKAYNAHFWFVFQLVIANAGVLGPYACLLSANLFATSLQDWMLALNWMIDITNSSCQFFKVEQCMMVLEVRPLQYIRVDWLIQIGYTSFQGLFRLVAPGKRETWTSNEDEEVTFCDFFLQRSEWRRGERLQSTPKWTWTTCAEKDESSLALHRYYVLRTPYRLVDKNEVKGNAKQQ